jgi:hypothetical protein
MLPASYISKGVQIGSLSPRIATAAATAKQGSHAATTANVGQHAADARQRAANACHGATRLRALPR